MAGEEEGEDLVVTLGEPEKPETPETPGETAAAAKPPPVPGPPPAQPVTPEAGVRELERQIAAERAERTRLAEMARRLQGERDQAVQYARDAERQGGTNYEAYLDSQIQGMTEQMDLLASQAEAAMSDGDFKAVAEINKKSNRLGGQLALAEREKLAVQQQRAAQPQQRQPQQRQPQQKPQTPAPTDPFERAIHGRSEPTKNFLRKHRELIRSDGTLKNVAIQAHENALDAGFTADTEAYFAHIEKLIALQTPAQNGNGSAAPAPQPGYAAPVARGPALANNEGLPPGQFRMTPKMRRLAEEQGVSPQEWASNYVRLLKEGRITPIT